MTVFRSIKFPAFFFLLCVLSACNSENANDCLKSSGTIVKETIAVTPFHSILVNEGIEMILKEGPDYEVVVLAGKNILPDIQVVITDNQLILSNYNSCNFFRDYTPATLYVTAPDIDEIRSATPFDIRSEGTLTYPKLHILSEDFNGDYLNTGDFYLTLNTTTFIITFNNHSNCFISGETENLRVQFFSGNSRFEGANLRATHIDIFHRSSNDIIVYPTATLEGDIYSTGNVIAMQVPPLINMVSHYKGKLLFQN